jgi:KaiC/GvpD/RAD55 family RecA-like ATPase
MRAIPIQRTSSGVEAIDALLGGLERGETHLVHGSESAAALCGLRFLVEGLRSGERVGLVTTLTIEELVPAFNRLGRNCLADVYEGKLAIVRSAPDLNRRLAVLPGLASVLIELECSLGDTIPDRVVFQGVEGLFRSNQRAARVREFAEWTRSLGSTTLLIARNDSSALADALRPIVRHSFRFEARISGGQSIQFMIVEKRSPATAALIDVDHSKGISLIDSNRKQQSEVQE